MSGPELVVVIVNYRSAALTLRCLETLRADMFGDDGSTKRASDWAHVVVVENDSGDGDALEAGIRARGFEGWVALDRAPKNGGYAYGNNRAVRPYLQGEHRPSFFWLLNPDTEVRPGACRALLEYFDGRPQVGIAGSRFINPDGREWPFAFRFPSLWSELDQGLQLGPVSRILESYQVTKPMSDQPERVDWMPGASMMVRREVFESVGLMDEGYFLYYEETDFCLAAARAGWEAWHIPASKVLHICGQSTGVTTQLDQPNRLPTYWFDSRRRYFTKNHGVAYATATDLIHLSALSVDRLRSTVEDRVRPNPKRERKPPHFWSDHVLQSVPGMALRGLFTKRG